MRPRPSSRRARTRETPARPRATRRRAHPGGGAAAPPPAPGGTAREGNERLRVRLAQPVEVGAGLPAEVEEVLEAGRRDERGAGALALEERVRRDRRPVREASAPLAAHGACGLDDRVLLVSRG